MISRSNRLRISNDSTWFLFWKTQIFHVYKTVYSPHESVFDWCQIETMNFYLSIYQSIVVCMLWNMLCNVESLIMNEFVVVIWASSSNAIVLRSNANVFEFSTIFIRWRYFFIFVFNSLFTFWLFREIVMMMMIMFILYTSYNVLNMFIQFYLIHLL
jgi:hypothetical protein